MHSRKKILLIYTDFAAPLLDKILRHQAPSERLYGYIQLRNRHWDIKISDARWIGPLATLRKKLFELFELPSLGVLRDMSKSDVILVKDEFSLTLLLQAKALGKRVIYLDAMFDLPRRFWRRWSARINLRFADVILCYSEYQAKIWAEFFNLPLTRFSVVRYCMDVNFYPQLPRNIEDPPFIIAVGSDLGRDFSTLIDAAISVGIKVKLITWPYLTPDKALNNPSIEVLERITYEELFNLYSRAVAAVVPLKKGVCYPSGIRAVLEGVLLGVPTIATITPVLEEYLDSHHVFFTPAEDVDALSIQLRKVLDDRESAEKIAANASSEIRRRFPIDRFANELATKIEQL